MMKQIALLSLSAIGCLFFLNIQPEYKKMSLAAAPNDTFIKPAIPANIQGFKGTSVSKSNHVVHFNSATDNDFYRSDTTGRHCFLLVETQIDEFTNAVAKRAPLNLSIVIDHSGSMAGDKIVQARKAASFLIDQLEPTDFVSIIMYDDDVDVLQSPVAVTNKDGLKQKINKIFPDGGTNLWGGTEAGYEQTKKHFKQGYINRVLLLSDGLANIGVTSQKTIASKVLHYKDQEGITLSTFGIGLDYNENLMTDMAETGSGNYYFIDDSKKMMAIFQKELNGMANVAAQNSQLTISIPTGVRVEKVYNFKYTQSNNDLVFSLRDLFSMETKSVLLYCAIDDAVTGPIRFYSKLSYTDPLSKQMVALANENIVNPIAPAVYAVHFNEKVIQQAILQQANENMERAMEETDRGNYDAARTISTMNGNFMSANASYVVKSKELQRMDSVTKNYSLQIRQAETMNSNDKKMLQKMSKEANYKMRTKKQ